MAHRIELDSIVVWSNKSEYRKVNRARFQEIESVGDGPNIVKLAAMMLEAGYTGPCEVYRGDMLVFHSANLEDWVGGKVLHPGKQPDHLRRGQGQT
jgi:hypothetical protein